MHNMKAVSIRFHKIMTVLKVKWRGEGRTCQGAVNPRSQQVLAMGKDILNTLRRGNRCMIYIHCQHYARLQPPREALFIQCYKLD